MYLCIILIKTKTMKNFKIEIGQTYKVTNKETKQTQILNADQLAKFVFKNDHNNYDIKNTAESKAKDFAAFVLVCIGFFIMFAIYIETYC